MPTDSRKEPRWHERKSGADSGRVWASTSLRRHAALAPYRKSSLETAERAAVISPGEKYPTPALIVLFGAAGAVVPIILLLLGKFKVPDLFGLTVFVWPSSIFVAGVKESTGHVTAMSFLLPVLANVLIYLMFGSLLWLGLVSPRSIVFLTIIGLIYLTMVGVVGSCQLLLG